MCFSFPKWRLADVRGFETCCGKWKFLVRFQLQSMLSYRSKECRTFYSCAICDTENLTSFHPYEYFLQHVRTGGLLQQLYKEPGLPWDTISYNKWSKPGLSKQSYRTLDCVPLYFTTVLVICLKIFHPILSWHLLQLLSNICTFSLWIGQKSCVQFVTDVQWSSKQQWTWCGTWQ